ncbi:phytochelatin synthase family protein [Paraburkholderia sp. PREW-6R]|uniref:phytochelatin synthase family protein n=1 Tax=Paraburkholderia sp. PREW-6R TaxID=3141544 RepID=UPI0031F55319
MFRESMMRATTRGRHAAWLAAGFAAMLGACSATQQPVNGIAAGTQAQAAQAQPPAAIAADGPLPVPPNLVALAQPAGQKRLMSSAYKQSYWPLSQYFETQRNEAYCSVATSVMVLNALGIRRPPSSLYPDFPFFSQADFFRGIDAQVANAAQVSREGMTLDQLAAALTTFPVDVKKYHANELTLSQFRSLIRETTARRDRFVLLNFKRVEIGETGGGHWSPLGAYDARTDSALLLDVARYKYPAVWVPLPKLYAGALSVDNVSNLPRGIVIVGKRAE